MEGVWVLGPNNIYTVGTTTKPLSSFKDLSFVNENKPTGLVTKYDGNTISTIDLGFEVLDDRIDAFKPRKIWGDGQTIYMNMGVAKTRVPYLSGAQWNSIDLKDVGIWENTYINSIWGLNSSNVFFGATPWGVQAGAEYDENVAADAHPWLLKFDGVDLEKIAFNNPPHVVMSSIWGTSPNNLYVGVADSDNVHDGIIYHYDGQQFTPFSPNIGRVNSMWGSATNDIYVASHGSSTHGMLNHYNGNSWESIENFPSTGGSLIDKIKGFGPNIIFITVTGTQGKIYKSTCPTE